MSDSSAFDQAGFYRLSNPTAGKNLTLALGLVSHPPRSPMMDVLESFSSENWQIFYNEGIYFLRNYDYGPSYQLGVDPENRSRMRMLLAAPGPGPEMQWNLTKSGNGWLMRNMLLEDNVFLGVGMTAATRKVPMMNTGQVGAVWSIDINTSAGGITDESMLTPIPLPASATPTPTNPAEGSATPTLVSEPSSSRQPDVGVYVGITAAAAIIVLVVMVLVWIFARRLRKQRNPEHVEIPSLKSIYAIPIVENRTETFELPPDVAVPELPPNAAMVWELSPTGSVIRELPADGPKDCKSP